MRSKPRVEILATLFTVLAVLLFGLSALAVVALNLPIVAAFDLLAVYSPKISTQTIQLNISVATYTPSPTAPITPAHTPGSTPPWTPPPTPTESIALTATSPPTSPAQIDFAARSIVIGHSAQERDITAVAFPVSGESAQALVLVCGIHGDEMNAWPVLQSLILSLDDGTLAQSPALGLYFANALNPDGVAVNSRLNANGIDLNRNWETYDWRTGIEVSPTDYLPAGGGLAPFSEPETRVMRDWLLALQSEYPGGVTVIYFHAAFPPKGLVTPGTHSVDGEDLADTPSRQLGEVLSAAAGYHYDNRWPGGYHVTGDASTWAVAQGMRSLTVELPVRAALDAGQFTKLRDGIVTVINLLGRR